MLVPVAMGSSGVRRMTGAANRKDAFNEEPSFLSNKYTVSVSEKIQCYLLNGSVAGFSVALGARLTNSKLQCRARAKLQELGIGICTY